MAYEMLINAGVTGQQQLDALGAATEKQEARIKRVSEAIQSYIEKSEKLSAKQASLALDEVKLEQLREKHRMSLEKLAAAAQKRAETEEQANARIAASIKNFIQNPLGAAGDAAEKFVISYGKVGLVTLGVGTGLAVVGGWLVKNAADTAKYAQETADLASRTGLTTTETQLYSRASEVAGINAGTLTSAMRTLSRGMSENSDEGKKQKKVLEELGMGADAAFKPMGQLLPELFEKLAAVGNVMERDRMTITLFGRSGLEMEPLFAQFKELEARVAASGVVMSKEGIEKAKAYQEELVLLGFKWDALKLKLGEAAIGVIEFEMLMHGMSLEGSDAPTYATGQEVLDQKREKQRIALHAQFASGNAAALDRYALSNQDPKARTAAQLKDLGEDRVSAENKVRGAVDVPGRDAALVDLSKIDAKINAIKAQTKATTELAAATERVIEIEKRAAEGSNRTEGLAGKDYGGIAGGGAFGRKLDADIANAEKETADQIRKISQNPNLSARQKAALSARLAGAGRVTEGGILEKSKQQAAKDMAEFDAMVAGAALDLKRPKETAEEKDFLRDNPQLSGFGRTLAEPAGYTSPEQALREARDNERRGMSQLGARNALAGGGEGDLIAATHAARMKYAEDEYQAQIRGKDAQDALAALEQRRYDANMERESALLEMAVKQKEQFQSLAVGFLDAARSGGTAQFLRGQVNHIADTAAGNAAGMIWPTIQKAMGGMHAQAGTTMGNLLQGTPFGPDPMRTAGVTLTKAGTDLIAAAADLRASAMSPSGGGGGLARRASSAFSAALPGSSGSSMGDWVNANGNTAYNDPLMATAGQGVPEFVADGSLTTAAAGGASRTGASSLAKGVGVAAALGAGAYGIYSGLHSGGVSGALTAGGSALGMVGAILPMISQSLAVAGPIGMAAGMALGLVTTILGDPKAREEQRIQNELKYNQFMAPVAINASMTTGGTYADFDRFGQSRGSGLSPFPAVEQGFFDYRHNTVVPGRTDSQFGGPTMNVTVEVQTLDSKSFNDNSHLVADAVQHALQTGKATGLQETLRSM